MFHLPSDHSLINRYGFPSDGHAAVISRLKGRIPTLFQETFDQGGGPASLREGKLLAVNLGKNKSSPPDAVADFVEGVKKFAGLADVLVVNVSSPNTPGLRYVVPSLLPTSAHTLILFGKGITNTNTASRALGGSYQGKG